MGISEAKKLIGTVCSVSWLDRTGKVLEVTSKIHDVTYVPLYGCYLVTDIDDIPLDKVTHLAPCAENVEIPVAA